MRIIAIVLVLSTCTLAQAQLAKESGFYTYHKTIRQEGTKEEIYAKALSWVHDHFEENKCGTIKYKSLERGKIVVEGSWEHANKGVPGKIDFKFMIEIRNGMYRETYSEFSYRGSGKDLPYESKKLGGKNQILVDTNELIGDYSEDLIGTMSHSDLVTR